MHGLKQGLKIIHYCRKLACTGTSGIGQGDRGVKNGKVKKMEECVNVVRVEECVNVVG